MTSSEKILASLRIGEDNAVSLSEECRISGLDERSTRRLIEDMRQHGQVICSSPKGYFFPANKFELRRYVLSERSRANSILWTLKSAENALANWNNFSKAMKAGDGNG